jgi:ribosomal protein S12 methylthiotransferase accessory factor
MVVGAMPSAEQKRSQPLESRFKVAPNLRPVAASATTRLQFAFAAGPAGGVEGPLLAGNGRASEPRVAMNIAEAEAWERVGWATLGRTREARYDELQQALDPRELVAYSNRQHRTAGFPFPRFDRSRPCLWTEAVASDTGAIRAVPAECVHAWHALPARLQATACTSASTSGVAAGANAEDALARATLELVERDAFCCAWLAGVASPGIVLETLPGDLRSRLQALEADGAEVSLIDLSTAWCTVIAVFLQARTMPFTAITAAAGFDVEGATAKAVAEAEGRLAFVQHFPRNGAVANDPMRAIEHYYRGVRTYGRSDFFRPAQSSRRFADVGRTSARGWEQMRSRMRTDGFDLLCADITPAGAAIEQGRQPLRVVRALVPGLVPIWFHRGLQPEGLRRFSDAGGVVRGRPAGHFLHPFT